MPRGSRSSRSPGSTLAKRWGQVLGWALLTLVALPTGAEAWTNAAVRHVHARVVLAPDATAHVTLTATVRVHGGWLEGVELAGLDPDLVLDEAIVPAAFDEAGRRYRPNVNVQGNAIQFSFPERSPRRGRVILVVAYRTNLAHRASEPVAGTERVRVRWTLPGWRSGLDGVEIELVAPEGSQVDPDAQADGASVTREVSAEGTHFRFRRAHLPRTVPWTVGVEVPADVMPEALRGAPIVRKPPPAPPVEVVADPRPRWYGLAALLALLVLGKGLAVRTLARRSRSRARSLLGLPAWLLALGGLALAAAGGALGPTQPLLAMALFALAMLTATYRTGAPRAPSRLGAWRVADARWLRAARRTWMRALAPSSLLDATTPLGLVHLLAWLTLPWAFELPLAEQLCLSVLPLPLLTTGTRLAFPSGPLCTLHALLGLARRLRALPDDVGLCPVVHVDVRGEVQEARVRTVLARRPRGLLRLDFALAEANRAGGHHREPTLLLVTRAGSPAEEALEQKMPDVPGVPSPGGRRVLRLLPLDALERVVSALADCPEAPVASRGTAALEETVHALPAPRAIGF